MNEFIVTRGGSHTNYAGNVTQTILEVRHAYYKNKENKFGTLIEQIQTIIDAIENDPETMNFSISKYNGVYPEYTEYRDYLEVVKVIFGMSMVINMNIVILL